MGAGGQRHTPAALTPGKRPWYPLYRSWIGHRTGLDRCRKSRPHRDSIRGLSSELHYWLCYPGSFPWVWGLSSSCDNLSVLIKVKYEIDVSEAGMRWKWRNSRFSCSFSIQMDRVSHTIRNSQESLKPAEIWACLSWIQTLHYLTAITCHILSLLYYMWAVGWVGCLNTIKCDRKWQPAVVRWNNDPTVTISPPGEEKK
jgi:hypothetical protein